MLKRPLLILAALIATTALDASAQPAGKISFTPEEQAYLAKAAPVRMCIDPDWAPFERLNEEGRHEGIAADLVQLVAERTGLQIELYPTRTWDESLAASKGKQCQILSFLNRSPDRDAWLIFTAPIFFDQNVIITREEHPFIGDLHRVGNLSVALPRGTMIEERIRRDFPDLTLITTGSEPEAIALVSERKADMTVRSLIVAAHAIKQEGLFNLKIAGHIPEYANELRIGVIQEEKLLRDILEKGVQTLTSREREAIANRHAPLQVQHGLDQNLLWLTLAAAALLLGGTLLWNQRLRLDNRKLQQSADIDKPTGCFNRRKMDDKLKEEVSHCLRSAQPLSLILLHLDHFKPINEIHGHLVGDQVLAELAQLIRSRMHKTDLFGRWCGIEFLVICRETSGAEALELAEQLRQQIEQHEFAVVGRQRASFGVAGHQENEPPSRLISRTEAALLEAKRLGGGQIVIKPAAAASRSKLPTA